MNLSNTVNIKALYTYGNELSQPEGSVVIADNVNMDENGVFTPRRGFEDLGQPLLNPSDRVSQLLSYKKTLIRHANNTLQWEDNGVFSQFAGVYEQLDQDIRIKYQEANSNLYFTTKNGIMKISSKSSTDFKTTPNYITQAGVPKAIDVYANTVYSGDGFLPPQSKVAYKVLFGKKDVNNNLLLGTPTSRYVVTNTSRDVLTFEKTYLEFKTDENFLAQRTILSCSTVGSTQETNGTTGINSIIKVHNTTANQKWLIHFDKGAGYTPSELGYTNIRVNLTGQTSGTPVAPLLKSAIDTIGGLTDINVIISGNNIVFTNLIEGESDGIYTPTGTPSTDIGAGWSITINVTGTAPRYIEKYFLVHSKTNNYCFYYGNDRTIDTIPSDPSLVDYTFVGILIGNQSTKSYIANQTSRAMLQEISSEFVIELTTSGINPTISMTSTNGGDVDDAEQGTIDPLNMALTVINQGSITEGKYANVEVKIIVPNNIDETFFFRVYRTPYQSATDLQIPLDDVDPGEECYLVYEEGVDLSNGRIITVSDTAPESFAISGEPLYNNINSGDGTSRNNDQPPIAVDICNYNGFTFYANTSTFQNISLDLLSIDGFVSNSTKITVANSSVRTYTLRGEAKTTIITCGEKQNTLIHTESTPNAKITLYSADDQTKYVIYFDDGTATSPIDTDAILIRVNIAELEPTDSVATMLSVVLAQFSDFEVSYLNNDVTIVNSENGSGTPLSTPTDDPSVDLGTGWSYVETVAGEGEDLDNGYVLLSKSPSIGLKLERTARSLVDVINADPQSIVNANYMSSQNSIPGKFRLESRNLSDPQFYIAISNGLGTNFNPEVPVLDDSSITDVEEYNDNETLIEIINHDFIDGEEVYLYLPDVVPSIVGVYSVSVVDNDHISIDHPYLSGGVTDSFFFFPFLVSDNLKVQNRLMFSKIQQPEAVPALNYIDIGTRDEPIERILALRDYLFILKTDGIFMLSGTDSLYFTVRQLDTEKIVCPDSAVVLNNQIYMLTNNSILTINESTPSIISRMIENKIVDITSLTTNYRRLGFGVSYEDDRAYILWLPSNETDTVSTQAYRYNIIERTWTRWTKSATCGLVVGVNPHLYIGDGDRFYTMKERKKKDRTDHADRNFEVFLGPDSVIRNKYRISDISNIEVGDVIIQSQYVSIDEYNLLLDKLDVDPGLPSTDYHTLYCKVGDNIASKLIILNQKLKNEDTSGTITTHIFNNGNWENMRENYNALIDELNNLSCITEFKDYEKSTRIVNYEHIITSIEKTSSDITVNGTTNFIQGSLQVYKQIKCQIRWNPIHFGNPSSYKQINTGFVMFDQNDFYKMKVSYSTDVSPSFEGREFFGKGVGFWGGDDWGGDISTNFWGGDGSDAPIRTIIPRNKQRCRYITVQLFHSTARDFFRVVGIGHNVRQYSERAYRGIRGD